MHQDLTSGVRLVCGKPSLLIRAETRIAQLLQGSGQIGVAWIREQPLAPPGLLHRVQRRQQDRLAADHADTFNRPFGNRIYPFPFSMPDVEAHYNWHNSSTNDPARYWLREQVAEALRQA